MDRLLDYLILALAVWRLSSLFADEDGPFDVFERVRTQLGVRYTSDSNGDATRFVPDDVSFIKRTIGAGIICRWCNSVWFGVFLAVLYVIPATSDLVLLLSLALALSTVAILVDKSIS